MGVLRIPTPGLVILYGARMKAAIYARVSKPMPLACEIWLQQSTGRECGRTAIRFCCETHQFVCRKHMKEWCLKNRPMPHELKTLEEGMKIRISNGEYSLKMAAWNLSEARKEVHRLNAEKKRFSTLLRSMK